MEDETPGVIDSASPAEPEAQLPTDRPVQNVLGEFNRKMGSLEQRLDMIASHLAQQQQQAPQAPPAPKGTHAAMSNDELWELAKAGNKQAFDAHQARKAAEVYQAFRSQENHQQLVNGQLNILNSRYGKALMNPQNELAQTRDQAYQLLVRRGYPASEATMLEATKTAIAERPDLAAEAQNPGARAREGARRVSAGNPGVTGATYKNDEPSTPGKARVSSEEVRLAQRMSIKDPAGAKERFLARRAKGQSSLGAVGGMLNEEDFV